MVVGSESHAANPSATTAARLLAVHTRGQESLGVRAVLGLVMFV